MLNNCTGSNSPEYLHLDYINQYQITHCIGNIALTKYHLILICRICSKCNKIRNSILMTNLLLVETQSTNLLLVRMSPHLIKPYKWHLYSRTMLLITTLCILPPTIKECTSNLYLVTLFKVNLPRFRITKVHTTINFSSTIIKLLTNPYTKL